MGYNYIILLNFKLENSSSDFEFSLFQNSPKKKLKMKAEEEKGDYAVKFYINFLIYIKRFH